MRALSLALAGMALAGTAALAGDCAAPGVPEMPDGGTATYEQMLEAMDSARAFQKANAAYMDCLRPGLVEATRAARAEGATQVQKAAALARNADYEAAVSAEEELVAAFNAELRAYGAANP